MLTRAGTLVQHTARKVAGAGLKRPAIAGGVVGAVVSGREVVALPLRAIAF